MADNQSKLHIVCYDITDPRRLGRVHRYLRKQGVPLQYSVFLVQAKKARMTELINDLNGLIDPQCDDVRVYPLPTRVEYVHLGRQLLPEGVALISEDLPQALFRSVA